MKKLIIILVLLPIICQSQIDYGLQVGVVNSNIVLKGIDLYGGNPKFSYLISGYTSMDLCKKVNLTLEAGVVNKGSRQSNTPYTLKYINLPVMIGYNVNEKITLSTGLEFSRLIVVRIGKTRVKDSYVLNHDVSYIFNASYSIERFGIDLRMVNGLMPIFEHSLTDSDGEPVGLAKEYNRAFQLIFKVMIN